MRRHDIDNLRTLIILLVVLYHVTLVYNCAGVPLNIGAGIPALDAAAYFCYPWFMPCLFLLAGVSARFSLERRGARGFLKERCRKLLLPFLTGMLLLGAPLCALTMRMAGYGPGDMLDYFHSPALVAFLLLMTGMGPLWFLPELLAFSLLLPPIRRLDREGRLWRRCAGAGMPALLLLALPVWAASQVLNAANRHLEYLLLFLAGYFVFSREEVAQRLQKWHLPLLAGALLLFAAVLWRFFGENYTAPAFTAHPLTVGFAWCAILAALGCARAWMNRAGRLAAFANARGFAVYLFHYLPLVAAAYALTRRLSLPVWANYALTLLAGLAVPLLLYEAVSRVPGLRTAFGIGRR